MTVGATGVAVVGNLHVDVLREFGEPFSRDYLRSVPHDGDVEVPVAVLRKY